MHYSETQLRDLREQVLNRFDDVISTIIAQQTISIKFSTISRIALLLPLLRTFCRRPLRYINQ